MAQQSDILSRTVEAYVSGKFRKAVRLAKKGLISDPGNRDLRKLRADALHAIGEHQQAKQIYELLIAEDSADPEYWFGYANTCYAAGDSAEARVYFGKFLAVQPGDLMATALLCHTLLRLEEAEQARSLLAQGLQKAESAAEQANAKAVLFGVKGLIDMLDGDSTKARASVLKAIACDPANRTLLEQLSWYNAPSTTASCEYTVTAKGSANKLALFAEAEVPFYGSYIVIADDQKEALVFIKEVSLIADPESLKIKVLKKRRNPGYANKGVVYIGPSFSTEALPVGSIIPESMHQ